MTETTSHNIHWLNDFNTDLQQRKSTKSFFPNGTGRFLFKEAVTHDPSSSKSPLLFHGGQVSSEPGTMGGRPIEVKIPRVKQFGGQPKERYILLKKYQGFVCSQGETTFTARLFENASEHPVIEAEFDLEELSETDRELAVEGAALVWTIGYHENGPRKRESLIYIRRRPGWTEEESKEAKADTEALTSGITWK
ncbi:MAG TPA: hypothetical protein VH619_05095 [Verrucomicrobiae bacterium]|jgi:hypothetical protein|nr:hypothetical protein [Verrucomicrobiae bacterium]